MTLNVIIHNGINIGPETIMFPLTTPLKLTITCMYVQNNTKTCEADMEKAVVFIVWKATGSRFERVTHIARN